MTTLWKLWLRGISFYFYETQKKKSLVGNNRVSLQKVRAKFNREKLRQQLGPTQDLAWNLIC